MFKDILADIRAIHDSHWLKVIISNRGFHALLTYRICNLLWRYKIPLIPMILTRIIQILYTIHIEYAANIAGGVVIVHGWATGIGTGVTIGKGCRIYHEVTLGISHGDVDGFAQVGENVLIGCGAKIIGPVKIGDNAKIGANAVVNKDVPANSVAVGIPARIIRKEAL